MSMAAVRRASQSGAAMIVVLWTFAVMSVLAAEFARAMRQEAQAVLNFKQETVAQYTALAGINEAILAIVTYNGDIEVADDESLGDSIDDNDDDEDDDDDEADEADDGEDANDATAQDEDERLWAIRRLVQGRGEWVQARFNGRLYEVRAFDESGKIPLNAADLEENALRRILENLGWEDEAVDVADAILDWRDEDDLHRTHGAETDYYEGLDVPYRAKNAPFDAVEELLLVKGVTRDMFYGTRDVPGLADIFTVVHSQSRITQNAISPEVEWALCGEIDEDSGEIDDTLGAADGEAVQDLATCIQDVGLGARRSDRNGKPTLSTARLESRVKDERGRVVAHVALTVRFKGDGFQVYQWYDAVFDGDEES
jgi:general secretion pathway protein K